MNQIPLADGFIESGDHTQAIGAVVHSAGVIISVAVEQHLCAVAGLPLGTQEVSGGIVFTERGDPRSGGGFHPLERVVIVTGHGAFAIRGALDSAALVAREGVESSEVGGPPGATKGIEVTVFTGIDHFLIYRRPRGDITGHHRKHAPIGRIRGGGFRSRVDRGLG